MLELRFRQQAKRTRALMLPRIAADELRAIRNLAVETFGKQADIYVPPEKPGVLHVGFFTDERTDLPPQQRQSVLVAHGRSHREIAEQIRLWKSER